MEQTVWKSMYLELVKSVSDVIELMPEERGYHAIRNLLIHAMQNAGEMYVCWDDSEIEEEEGETDRINA